jgi:Serine carboxypeptidase S28
MFRSYIIMICGNSCSREFQIYCYLFSNLTQEDLSFLTIKQALLDIANFAQIQKTKEPELYSGPWVLYGSGYSANLASWARAQFPDLFVGAYASCPRLWVRPSFNGTKSTCPTDMLINQNIQSKRLPSNRGHCL